MLRRKKRKEKRNAITPPAKPNSVPTWGRKGEALDGTGAGGRGGERRKWILIPLILFMLITRLSLAKDFHNNGLVLPLLRGSAGVIGEKVVDVES